MHAHNPLLPICLTPLLLAGLLACCVLLPRSHLPPLYSAGPPLLRLAAAVFVMPRPVSPGPIHVVFPYKALL